MTQNRVSRDPTDEPLAPYPPHVTGSHPEFAFLWQEVNWMIELMNKERKECLGNNANEALAIVRGAGMLVLSLKCMHKIALQQSSVAIKGDVGWWDFVIMEIYRRLQWLHSQRIVKQHAANHRPPKPIAMAMPICQRLIDNIRNREKHDGRSSTDIQSLETAQRCWRVLEISVNVFDVGSMPIRQEIDVDKCKRQLDWLGKRLEMARASERLME